MREVLLGEPQLQVALYGWAHLQEANSGVAHFVDPGNFALKLQSEPCSLEAES
jgi:hypothetical protein